MGFLDDMQSAMNRGVASADRTARSTKLKMQQGDLLKQRKELAAQLGASLYDATKDDPAWRAGRETVYDGIAEVDRQRAEIDAELARLANEAAQQAAASMTYTCPVCGGTVRATDAFCAGCGTPTSSFIPQQPAAAAPAGSVCPSCGAPVGAGDKFCMTCGAKIEAPAASVAPVAAPDAPAADPAAQEPAAPAAPGPASDAPEASA